MSGASPSHVTRLTLKVVPRASRDEVAGWLDGALKVRVAAPPTDGRANAAVEALLAEALGVKRGAVKIVAGHGSSRKRVEIEGLDSDQIIERLGAPV